MKNLDIFYDEQNNVYQVRTKNDTLIFEFVNKEEERIFLTIIKLYEQADTYSFDALRKELRQFEYEQVLDVVQELKMCGFLNAANFTETDALESGASFSYSSWAGITAMPSLCHLCFIGHSRLGKCFRSKALQFGYENLRIIETPTDKLTRAIIDSIACESDFVVMDAYYWNPRVLSEFNETMLLHKKPWLYVDGMIDDLNYSIGPIFHGEETGCYECMQSRIAGNDVNNSYTQSYKKYLIREGAFSKNKECSLLIEDILASMILLDINKYIFGTGVPETWKNVLLFNTTDYSLSKQYFLKNPLCDTCNPKLPFAYSPWT